MGSRGQGRARSIAPGPHSGIALAIRRDAAIISLVAAVAQLDRVLGYEPRGRGFNSCQPHQLFVLKKTCTAQVFFFVRLAGGTPTGAGPTKLCLHRRHFCKTACALPQPARAGRLRRRAAQCFTGVCDCLRHRDGRCRHQAIHARHDGCCARRRRDIGYPEAGGQCTAERGAHQGEQQNPRGERGYFS